MNRSGQASKTVIALLAAVVLLGSSSVYLASIALKPQDTGSSLPSEVAQKLQTYPVMSIDPTTVTSSSANSISVTGNGEVSYTPNEALVDVSVLTQNATAESATQSNAQKLTSVIGALEGIGISNSSMQTEGYSLNVDYASCYSTCVPSITGYTVTDSLQVNITSGDPSALGARAGQVIDTAVRAGADQVSLYFGATQSVASGLQTQALQRAVGSADSQAQAIASSLGVSITGVISATSSGSPYYPQINYGVQAALASAVSTPIMPGTQTLSAAVLVVYSI